MLGDGRRPAATRDYRESMNPLRDFVDDACILRPGARVLASDLWSRFPSWGGGDPERPFVKKGDVAGHLEMYGVKSVKGTHGNRYYGNILLDEEVIVQLVA